jgi:hypothetical protein
MNIDMIHWESVMVEFKSDPITHAYTPEDMIEGAKILAARYNIDIIEVLKWIIENNIRDDDYTRIQNKEIKRFIKYNE